MIRKFNSQPNNSPKVQVQLWHIQQMQIQRSFGLPVILDKQTGFAFHFLIPALLY